MGKVAHSQGDRQTDRQTACLECKSDYNAAMREMAEACSREIRESVMKEVAFDLT